MFFAKLKTAAAWLLATCLLGAGASRIAYVTAGDGRRETPASANVGAPSDANNDVGPKLPKGAGKQPEKPPAKPPLTVQQLQAQNEEKDRAYQELTTRFAIARQDAEQALRDLDHSMKQLAAERMAHEELLEQIAKLAAARPAAAANPAGAVAPSDPKRTESRPKAAKVVRKRETFDAMKLEVNDVVSLEGLWTVTSAESAGERAKSTPGPLRFKERTVEVQSNNGPIMRRFALMAGKSPKELTIYGDGLLMQAIYKLDDDTLTLAFVGNGEVDRPKGFTAAESGSSLPLTVWVLKREDGTKSR